MVEGKVWDGYEVLGWVRKAWDLSGGLRAGVKGYGIVWMERMSMEGLIWVSRALVRCGGPEMGARGFRCVWRAWNGY